MLEHVGWPNLLVFTGVLLAALGSLWSSIEAGRAERLLREKSDKIAELNQYIAESVTGGDGFILLEIANIDADKNTGILTLVNKGDQPMYDVSVDMVDVEQGLPQDLTLESWLETRKQIRAGNLPGGHALLVGRYELPQGDRLRLRLFVSARNGSTTQTLRLRKVNGEWRLATRVTRRSSDGRNLNTIFEKIDDEYPRSSNGEIDWE